MSTYHNTLSLIQFFLLIFLANCINLKNQQPSMESSAKFSTVQVTTPEKIENPPKSSFLNHEMHKKDLRPENFYTLKNVTLIPPSVCNYLNCASPHGVCADRHTCICNDGYVHAPYITGSKIDNCKYKQQNQQISFFLELFLFFGVGHYYSMRIMIGSLKLLLTFLCYSIFDYFNSEECDEVSLKKGILKYFGYIFILSFFVVHFYDIVQIAKNKYLDGNGIPLFTS